MNVILSFIWCLALAILCYAVIANWPNLFLGVMAVGFICLPFVLPIIRKGRR